AVNPYALISDCLEQMLGQIGLSSNSNAYTIKLLFAGQCLDITKSFADNGINFNSVIIVFVSKNKSNVSIESKEEIKEDTKEDTKEDPIVQYWNQTPMEDETSPMYSLEQIHSILPLIMTHA